MFKHFDKKFKLFIVGESQSIGISYSR